MIAVLVAFEIFLTCLAAEERIEEIDDETLTFSQAFAMVQRIGVIL
jgi:hypothetical protein